MEVEAVQLRLEPQEYNTILDAGIMKCADQIDALLTVADSGGERSREALERAALWATTMRALKQARNVS